MVYEVASTWTRLEECRERERLFFSLMRAKEGLSDKPGTEVTIWYDKPHKAYDQICRAIRDAELAFHRAVQRADAVIGRRAKIETKAAKVVVIPRRTVDGSPPPSQPDYVPLVRTANSG